jgi:hypothetical protein
MKPAHGSPRDARRSCVRRIVRAARTAYQDLPEIGGGQFLIAPPKRVAVPPSGCRAAPQKSHVCGAERAQAPCVADWGATRTYAYTERAMADNKGNKNETLGLGLLLGGVVAFSAFFFVLTGGEFGGKRTVESDKDMPPIAKTVPPQ